MAALVFLETSVIRTHAHHLDIGNRKLIHPGWGETAKLVSMLGTDLAGISTRYVIKEVIDGFIYDVSAKYKDEIPLEHKDYAISQFRMNVAQLEGKLKVYCLWSSSDPATQDIMSNLFRKVNDWYFRLVDMGSVVKELEPSDRKILSESWHIRGVEQAKVLQFATQDGGFIKLRPKIMKAFAVDPRWPQDVRSNL